MKLFRGNTFLASLVFLMIANTCLAQQSDIRQNYKRAEQLLPRQTYSLIHHQVFGVNWLNDGRLLYLDEVADGTMFMVADPATGQKSPLFDQEKLANTLSGMLDKKIDPMHLPLRDVSLSEDNKTLKFNMAGTEYSCEIDNNYNCKGDKASGTPSHSSYDEVRSPDGSKTVFIKDYNLWMRNLKTGERTQLTHDGEKDYGYGTNNGGWTKSDRPVVRWSPDSKRIATFRQDSRNVGYMYLVNTKVGHSKLEKWKYPLPGDSAFFRIERVIINLKPQPEVVHLKMKPDPQRSTISDHIAGRGSSFLDTQWSPDSDELAFVSVSRDLTQETLKMANPETGDVRTVMHEEAKGFLQPGSSVRWHVLSKSGQVIWYSQRSNWGQLYMYDLQTGKLKHPITQGDWNVLQIDYIDQKNQKIYFTGSCRQEGNPYYHYLYSIDFSGKNLKLLTPEEANHSFTLSDKKDYFMDTYSTPETPPVSVLRNMDGKKIMTLAEADISDLKATGWQPPIPFTVKARDGKTDLYGMMFKPTNFDSSKTYPVIDYVYPGPQSGSIGSWSFGPSGHQALAELGFIVVEVNALGTPGRSKSFQTYWYGDMHDNGIPDQVATIRQLAGRHAWMDTTRVGIWGHSGGGYASTDAMLTYPDFFKVAVSESGNHDNRNYESDWGDKYQGLLEKNDVKKDRSKPYVEGDNYDSQANENYVDNLKGHLLIVCGLMDDNVPPSNTLLVADALIKANKNFDMFIIPNAHHGYGYANTYWRKRRWAYFLKYLKGVEPPADLMFSNNK